MLQTRQTLPNITLLTELATVTFLMDQWIICSPGITPTGPITFSDDFIGTTKSKYKVDIKLCLVPGGI